MFLIIQSVSGPSLEKKMYTAMEDLAIGIVIGEGQSARSRKNIIAQITLIGVTTRLGVISTPLRDRFSIPLSFQFYQIEKSQKIVVNVSQKRTIKLDQDGTEEIAKRARATPRITIRLFQRVRDFATYQKMIQR